MGINTQTVDNPNRRKVTKYGEQEEIVETFAADIEREPEENESENATEIDTEFLESMNSRNDKSLSYKVLGKNDPLPTSLPDKVQLFTTHDGKTYLLPAGDNMEAVEIHNAGEDAEAQITPHGNNVFNGVNTFENQVRFGESSKQITMTTTIENGIPVLIIE